MRHFHVITTVSLKPKNIAKNNNVSYNMVEMLYLKKENVFIRKNKMRENENNYMC